MIGVVRVAGEKHICKRAAGCRQQILPCAEFDAFQRHENTVRLFARGIFEDGIVEQRLREWRRKLGYRLGWLSKLVALISNVGIRGESFVGGHTETKKRRLQQCQRCYIDHKTDCNVFIDVSEVEMKAVPNLMATHR